jgi:hypothetical protein
MADDDAVVRDAERLPWAERLAHAHWKVRSEAYAAVATASAAGADANESPLVDFGACPHPLTAALCAHACSGAPCV